MSTKRMTVLVAGATGSIGRLVVAEAVGKGHVVGDRHHAGDPSDGVVSRRQIAEVLVASLTSDAALRKSFELVATRGSAPQDLDTLFAPLEADVPGALDAVRDLANMPLEEEPQRVREELEALKQVAR